MENIRASRSFGRFRQSGFTLIELLIVVAIIAILASIAVPSYQEHVRKGHRAAAQTEMMDIANRQQQYFLANRRYATQTELGYTPSADVGKRYTPAIAPNNGATPPSFTITFTAKGSQTADGNLGLNSEGVKTPAGKW